MEPTAQGRTEKTFSYVVRAPISDGFDMVNVDVKIDTCWVFQDVEESSEEQGCLPQGVASIPDVDAGQLREQQESSSEQKLLAAVDKYMMSESGLRSRVQELQLSERRLLQKVDQLSTRVAQERNTSLRAQEQLRVLKGELASRVREAESMARRQRRRLRCKEAALARQAAALERCRRSQQEQLGLAREQERVLRAQVQRLERDVGRLGRAAGFLLTQVPPADRAQGSGGHGSRVQVLAGEREQERAEAASRRREQRAGERRLREQVEELRCWVYGLTLSEIGLHGQVEELTEQNRRLRAQLGAQAPAAPASLGVLDCAQGDSPPRSSVEATGARRSQGRLSAARGVQASAGWLSEGLCSSTGDGPCEVVPGSGTMSERRGVAGSERGQGAPGESSQDGRVLLLPCGCPQGQCTEERHTPGAKAYAGWVCSWTRSHDISPGQASPNMSNGPFSRKGPKGPRDMRKRGSEALVARAEGREGRGAESMMEGEFHDHSQPGQESGENLSLGTEIQAAEGVQEDPQGTARCPWPLPQCSVLSLWGLASGSQEVLESLSGREMVEVCSWGLLSSEEVVVPMASSSRDHSTREPWPNFGQLPAGKDQVILRRTQDQEGHRPFFGDGLLGHGVVSRLEQPDSEACMDQEMLFMAGEQGVLQFPKWAMAGAREEVPLPPGTLSTEHGRQAGSSSHMDELEREVEVCFWKLNTLKLGGEGCQQMPTLVGDSWNLALTGLGSEEGPCPQQALSSQCPDACSAKDAEPRDGGEGAGLEENMALVSGRFLPETSPDGDKAGSGSTKLGRSQLSSAWGAKRTKGGSHQLLRKERNQLLCDHARLQGDQEKCHREVCHFEKEQAREAAQIWRLEQANRTLQGELGRIRQELHQYLQTFSDLEDCNMHSYSKISQLEDENERLKADLQRLQTALSESVRKDRGAMEHVALENRELKALITELGVSYKELIKDIVLGIEDMVRGLQEENQHLLRRVQGLEQEVALKMNRDKESWGEGPHPEGDTKMAGDKGCTADKEVQVTALFEQLTTRACRPPLDEEACLVGGHRGPSSDLEDSTLKADATTLSLASREAEIPQDQQEHTDAGKKASWLKNENKPQARSFLEPGQALWSLSHGPQLQDSEATDTEEDPSLCVQRLRHQVRTLQCQLRDQGSALWQLQAARDKAVGLQDELKGKLEELREQQHEAHLAMSPLKAKLASLVRKCQERNCLIVHLLWEMQKHGSDNLLLSRWAQNILNDVALTEYAATFLDPGAPETSYHLDVGPEGTAASGAQEYLVDSEVDNTMQSPLGVSWPLPKTEWMTQAAWLDSLKLKSLSSAHQELTAESELCDSQK